MKITTNTKNIERKLCAVVGLQGIGIYFEGPSGTLKYLNNDGRVEDTPYQSLQEVAEHFSRTAVYEGDTITLKF